VDGYGVPIGLAVAGANRHDMKLAEPTLESIVIPRPRPTKKRPQNLCLDKGYDFPEIDELVEEWGYTGHIARRGVDQSKRKRIPGYRARRWVVERTHSWMNRFRRLLIRWEEKKKELRRDVTSSLCVDHVAGSWTREVIFSGLALMPK
jgi:putative transposase